MTSCKIEMKKTILKLIFFVSVVVILFILYYNGLTYSKSTKLWQNIESSAVLRNEELSIKNKTPTTTAVVKKDCQPHKNLVYLKTHKTASSAVQNILLRRAAKEKLKILQPPNNHNFKYPSKFSRKVVPNQKANIICHHSRFSYEEMKAVMPADSLWVTSVREPLSLYRSSISYFREIVPSFQKLAVGDSIERWYDNAAKFTATSPRSAYSHFAKSHMFFDMGFDNKRDDDDSYVTTALKWLDGIFDLVVVSDHFDESMVLLSDLLCWPIEDFACLTVNARVHDNVTSQADDDRIRDKVRQWNRADARIFDHFNASLWQKVESFGRERMNHQLQLLSDERERLSEKCLKKSQPVLLDNLKDDKQRKSFYRPPGVKLSAYELKEGAKDDVTCEYLVKPENSLSAEIFRLQKFY